MKKNLLILMALCLSLTGFSQTVGDTFTNNFLTYEVTSVSPNIVKITDYDANGGTSVGIPGTATFSGEAYAVTEIGDGAFNNKGLTSVGISDNITSIDNSAFANNQLTSFNIPGGITIISELCFQNNQLTNIVIPDGVTFIQDGAFENNSLTTITIPNNISIIEGNAFIGNPLTSVTCVSITPSAISTGSEDSFAIDRSGIDLNIPDGTAGAYVTDTGAQWTGFNSVTEASPLGVGDTFMEGFITYEITSISPNEVETHNYDHYNGSTNVVIPASASHNGTSYIVTSIGEESFEYDGGLQLTSVVIPNSITEIGPVAFGFNQITTVIIPDGVTTIGHEAFRENSLTSVSISDSVITIGFEAFQENSLITVTLGNSLEVIEVDAFASNQIGSITFPSSLTTIEKRAFQNNQLTSVTIPSTITTLGNSVFRDNQLVIVTLGNGLTAILSDTFFNNQIQSITIPDTVTTIGQSAFENNQLTSIIWNTNVSIIDSAAFRNNQLTSVTIPNGVTTMGTRVFLDNPLTSVTSEGMTPPTIFIGGTIDTFATDRSGIDLTIPNGTENAYIAAQWINFASVTLNTSDFKLANAIKVITTADAIKIIASNNIRLESYSVYSITGAKIAIGTETEISTSALANGIYVLKLDFDKGTVTKKVIVN